MRRISYFHGTILFILSTYCRISGSFGFTCLRNKARHLLQGPMSAHHYPGKVGNTEREKLVPERLSTLS